MTSLGLRLSLASPVLLVLQVLLASQGTVHGQGVNACQVCERYPGSCRRIAGLYTVTVLTKGTYNPIVEIPPQACNINITELAPSQNHLAVKTDRGDIIVNGFRSVGTAGTFKGVGTDFKYAKGVANCPGECITAPGPTDRRIIVQLLYYQKNPGIAYSFLLPNDVPFQPFDQAAPQLETQRRSQRHRQRGGRVRPGQASQLAPEPYTNTGRVASQLQEPRGRAIPSQRTGAVSASDRDGASSSSNANPYTGSSYGSHTLGGRGQSYSYQYPEDSSSASNPALISNRRASSGSSSPGVISNRRTAASSGSSSPGVISNRRTAASSGSNPSVISSRRTPSGSEGLYGSRQGAGRPAVLRSRAEAEAGRPGRPSVIRSRGDAEGSRSGRPSVIRSRADAESGRPGRPSVIRSRGDAETGRPGRPSVIRSRSDAETGRPGRPSVIRSRAEGGQGATYSSSFSRRQRPTLSSRPSWRQRQYPNYVSAYDTDRNRGFQTLASSSSSGSGGSRGGLVDRTFSRNALETDNRLQTFERPLARRPALSIGTGGGGNEYEWTISGLTECSQTCGGGVQTTEVVCVLTSSGTQVVVTEDNCQNALKPQLQRVSCNNEPCPPAWETEEWSECTVTCGGGTQSRRIECRQRFSDTLELSVSASQCDQAQKPAVAQQCNNDPCAQWKAAQWGECSAECGGGEREREVECVDGQEVQIPASFCKGDKPAVKERCNSQPCSTQWWHTHWSNQCSASCGTGVTTRNVVCVDRSGRKVTQSACNSEHRPRDRKRCENNVGCGSQWFAGPWTQCSDSCGAGVRTRQVVCMQKKEAAGGLVAVDDSQCPSDTKPNTEEACFNSACGAQHYMSAWGQCSVTCGSGVKTREVRCLDENQQPSWSCDRSRAPNDRERCELSPCPVERAEVRERPAQTSRSRVAPSLQPQYAGNVYIEGTDEGAATGGGDAGYGNNYLTNANNEEDVDEDFYEEEEGGVEEEEGKALSADPKPIDDDCKNTFWNCRVVVQARLCSYGFYRKVCCAACRRVV